MAKRWRACNNHSHLRRPGESRSFYSFARDVFLPLEPQSRCAPSFSCPTDYRCGTLFERGSFFLPNKPMLKRFFASNLLSGDCSACASIDSLAAEGKPLSRSTFVRAVRLAHADYPLTDMANAPYCPLCVSSISRPSRPIGCLVCTSIVFFVRLLFSYFP